MNLFKSFLLSACLLVAYTNLFAQQCVLQSLPTPQMGAMIAPQFVNLWKMVSVDNKHGLNFKNGYPSIGDDGWLCEGAIHNIRFYPTDILPKVVKGDILKVRFKGTISQVGQSGEDCVVQNIISAGEYVTFEAKILTGTYPNGFVFQLKNRCTDIEILRPDYEFGDPRLLTDEYTQHMKTAGWKTIRYMGLLSANSNFGETWSKRVSPNSPAYVNRWAWSAPDCNNLNPLYPKFSEDQMPYKNASWQTDGIWSPGAPWETIIDISNYLNKDMWINIPVMADDEYVYQLAQLIKKRLKPSLNVNVEIGNELWNNGTPFMGFYMLRQKLVEEWKQQNPEKLKILGGKYCLGCNLYIEETNQPNIDRAKCENVDYTSMQRWQARRLKEHAESFAQVYGWRDEGGEVGTKIRMVLAGMFYGTAGHGWNIGPGVDFLRAAYGNNAPRKYLYAVAIAPYFGPRADPSKETKEAFDNMSIEDIEKRTNLTVDSYFNEFSTYTLTTNPKPVYFGNYLEGLYAKAVSSGLKMYAYEGGNEISTSGNWGSWNNPKNTDAFLSSPRAAAVTKRFLDKWYSRFGGDALFIKNGDYQGSPMGGYDISHTLNDDSPLRNEYMRIANNPAIALSNDFGNLLSGDPLKYLDARKYGGYNSDWENNIFGFPTMGLSTKVNPDYSFKSSNSSENPFIIRCNKSGKYKLSLERSIVDGRIESDKSWPTYCDIYIDDKLIAAGVNMEAESFSRNIKYPVDNYDRVFWWTKDIILDIPYGAHVLRIHPSEPTAARPGNDGYYGANNVFDNKFDLAQYRFKYESNISLAKPKGILGDLNVCKANSKASYEVAEMDVSVCEYEWSGLPYDATILDREPIVGSSPARFKSGQGTYKIFIDWSAVSTGTYTLKVVAKTTSESGANMISSPLTFYVKVETCGFEIAPKPACINNAIMFIPSLVTGVSKFVWDNGELGSANRYTIKTDASPYTHTYMKAGTYEVSLKTVGVQNEEKVYYANVFVYDCNPLEVSTADIDNARFMVFPNPSNGVFEVATHNIKDAEIEVIDAQLRSIKTIPVNFSQSSVYINLSELSNGMYYLKINNIVQKVVLNK